MGGRKSPEGWTLLTWESIVLGPVLWEGEVVEDAHVLTHCRVREESSRAADLTPAQIQLRYTNHSVKGNRSYNTFIEHFICKKFWFVVEQINVKISYWLIAVLPLLKLQKKICSCVRLILSNNLAKPKVTIIICGAFGIAGSNLTK